MLQDSPVYKKLLMHQIGYKIAMNLYTPYLHVFCRTLKIIYNHVWADSVCFS